MRIELTTTGPEPRLPLIRRVDAGRKGTEVRPIGIELAILPGVTQRSTTELRRQLKNSFQTVSKRTREATASFLQLRDADALLRHNWTPDVKNCLGKKT